METNDSSEIERAEENTPDQPSSLTPSSSDKATTAAQVIPACSSLPTSTPDQPTESVQDAAMQSTAAEHDGSYQLIALVQDVNDRSEVLDQCGIGLPVTGNQIVTNQGGTEQSNEEEPVSTVESVSANQSETDQPMEVDQFVASEPGETDQPATEEQSLPDQITEVAQVVTDSSIVAQNVGCHTVTGLADGQFVSEDQSESVQLMSVDHSVNKLESGHQTETDHPMEIDVSGNYPYVVEDQSGNGQPATGEQCVVEQLEVSSVETDQSIVKVQDEACQLLTVIADDRETGQLVSVEQIGSHDLEAVDNSGNDQFVAADQSKTGQSVTNDQFVVDGQFETVNLVLKSQDSIQTEHGLANEGELISEDQSESHELMVVDSGKDQSLTSDHSVTGPSEMGDPSVTEEFIVVGQVEHDHSIVEDQNEMGQTETWFQSEGETSPSVSGDQNVSDHPMVDDSGNDQSVSADQSVTGQSEIGDPSVTEPFIVVGQVENYHSAVDQDKTGQTETGFPSEGETSRIVLGDQNVSDHPMVDDSGNYQSVTADQSVTGQSEIGDPSVTEPFIVVGQVENDKTGQTETGFPSEGETSRIVLGNQNVSDQLMVDDDSGNDQSVTANQDVTCQSVTEDQSVPDQFIAVGQLGSDQSVVEGQNETALTETVLPHKVGTRQLILGDQCGADQLMVVDSGNEQSVTVDHSGTGQSVVPNEVGTNQLVLGDHGSDELMVVESGNDQSVTVEQGGTDQSSPDQIVTDTFVEVAAHQPIVEHQSGFGLEDGCGTCQKASGNQSGNDQLVADEPCGYDQSVIESQSETILEVALNLSVPDQSVALSQDGNDQIVPGNRETDQSNIDQVGLEQPNVTADCGTDQFSSVAPDFSDQETATVHICLDQSSAITPSVTDHCTPASPEDITDHPMAAESEGTVQSEVKAQDSANQIVALASTGLEKIVFTPYDAVAREKLLQELCNIKFFSIVTEEEFANDGQPYISVGIHYLNKQDVKCENILAFIPLSTNITSFVDTLTIAISEKWGLNLALCRSQTWARPGFSVSQMTQASALLSQRLPHAFTFPNLVTPKSLLACLSSLREITHCFECLEQLFVWFSEDIQRRVRLEDAVVHLFQEDEKKASELKAKISSNQLAMSHGVLELTTDILEAIVLCLNEMKGNHDEANTAQAQSFLSAIQSFDFILSVVIMKNILSLTKSISMSLQGNSYDVYQAVNRVYDLLPSLSEMKNSIDSHHQTWFQEAVALASKQVPSLQPPLNVHYREDISKGAIEHCIAEMEGLSQDVLSAVRCLQVVPYVMSKVEGCCNNTEFVKVFQDVLPDPNSFQDELQRWRDRWQDCIASHQHLPDTVLGTLKTSDIESFPNISTILRLLAVLPISSTQSSFTQGKMKSELYPL